MSFLDLIYKRYPNADGYLERAFRAHRLADAINETIQQNNEERLFDLWKARCFDKTFDEFKAGVDVPKKIRPVKTQKKKKTAEVVADSFNILATFNPNN